MIEPAVGKTAGIRVAYVRSAAQGRAEKLKAIIEARLNCGGTRSAKLSQALGVHTGPGTAAVCYAPWSSIVPGSLGEFVMPIHGLRLPFVGLLARLAWLSYRVPGL
jgi:hypothetical protein